MLSNRLIACRARNDRDALGDGGTVVLADAAADTSERMNADAIAFGLNRGGTQRALVHADLAGVVLHPKAWRLLPDRGAHVDLGDRCWQERSAGAVMHAGGAIADDARHRFHVDIRCAVAEGSGRVELDVARDLSISRSGIHRPRFA